MAGPLRLATDGLSLAVRVQPGAGRDRLVGLQPDAAGDLALKLKVAAPPEDGRANAAVIRLLAKALQLPRGSLSLRQGERDRSKVVAIASDRPAELLARLEALLAALPAPERA